MKKLLIAIYLLGACALHGVQTPPQSEFSMPTHQPKEAPEKVVRLKIEIEKGDISEYGLQKAPLFNEIMTRLTLAAIQVREKPSAPQLILRVKVIQADRAVASFIQLAFFEEANLSRNQSIVEALTWSQATMLSCAKSDLNKEVEKVVGQMINDFIVDYQKAMVPL